MHLPDANSPTPPEIQSSPKFSPFFDHALGAIDGTHIHCTYLPQTLICQGTARVCPLKTALLHVPLIFASHTFCPVGRDPHMTPFFSMMPVKPISTSQGIGITLQMLALPCQMHCLSLSEMCGTICQNGIVPIMHKWVSLIKVLTNISSKSMQPQGTV